MAAAGHRTRRDHRLPGQPGLGSGHRPTLCRWGRLPARGRRVGRRVLRHLAARGTDHGSAAAADAGDLLGGGGTRRHRPTVVAGQPDRRVRRRDLPGVRRPGRRVLVDRQRDLGGVRSGGVHPRVGGSGRHRRHGLLLVAGRAAPGRPGAAGGGVLARPGRRRGGPGRPVAVRGVQQTGRPRPGRAVQVVRQHGGRDELVRRYRSVPAGAAVRRAAQRPPGPGGDPWLRGEPGWGEQRAVGAERTVAAAGDPAGAGRRRTARRRGGRGRGPRNRYPAGRSHRGAGAAGHLRAGPHRSGTRGIGQVEHRARRGGGRRGRGDEDGPRDAGRHAAAQPARGRAVVPGGLGGGSPTAADRAGTVAGGWAAPTRGCVGVRDQRHQRPRDPGGGRGRRRGARTPPGPVRAVAAVGPYRAGVARPGTAVARVRRPRPR